MKTPQQMYESLPKVTLNRKCPCSKGRGCCEGFDIHCSPSLTADEIKYFKKHHSGKFGLRDSLAVKKNGNCIFVDDKTMMCGIYENRPLDCRMYPLLPMGPYITCNADCVSAKSFERGQVNNKFLVAVLKLLQKQSPEYIMKASAASCMGEGWTVKILGEL